MTTHSKKEIPINREKDKLSDLEYRLIRRKRQQSKYTTIFILSVLFIIVGLFFWFESEELAKIVGYSSDLKRNTGRFKLWGSFFAIFSTVGFAYLYMIGFKPKQIKSETNLKTDQDDKDLDYLEIISVLKSIDRSIEKGKLESVLSDEERNEIISNISSTIDTKLNNTLLSKIESIYGTTIHNNKLGNKADQLLTETVKRLHGESEVLQKKASVNLAFGIGATIIAIFILVTLLIYIEPPEAKGVVANIFYYTSRFFLVLMVQGIAIFFFQLYKKTLSDIRYINNEITNYEAKRDSLSLAFLTGETESSKEMLLLLAQTERNFTLKEGETSVLKNGSDISLDLDLIKNLVSKLPN